ncbi:pilus assembly protein [Brevundimonas naejangsanensis]|uniref:Pilus assembly protein n=1 Tax=Brevundimonas naejangsanensis TaxID=588932 RepID=A0A494RGA0_9CAUL|nr:TadE/TadG family type IV pilus assembly protein [Brevundimonas naejangsanensis]AYG94469.1 pilus assembly protein [Brevundimonas naejangsanensis]
MRGGLDLKRRRREGSTAVEFAMVALPFFLLLFGILEIGLLLLVDALAETAVSDAGRQVRTGQAQELKLKPEDIKARLCANMSVFAADCPNRAFIDIRVVDDFSDPVAPDPLASGLFDPSVLRYQPGGPGDRVLVRVWYEQPIITPFIAQALSRTTDHRVMLTTTLAFRNEPYQ